MNPKVANVLASMKFYQSTYPEDACVVVADTERVVGYLPGERIDLRIKVGTPVEAFRGTVTEQSLHLGKKIREERGPELFGFAYIATATPIVDEGEVVGVVSAVVSNDKLDTLRVSASELAAVVEEMTATTDTVAQASNDVAQRVEELAVLSNSVYRDIDNIHAIATFVQQIAAQSNLLGLNAAIEAARAGESGRGFGVVATEIRKMADNSKNSAKEIAEQLVRIQKSVESMNQAIQQITADMEENAASVQELKATFEHIATTAENLSNLAH